MKESDTSEREKTSFVDYDELDSLLGGIDYISRVDRNITLLTNVEAEYRTKEDFSVITFSTGSGIHLAVSSGRCGKVIGHLEISDLIQLKTLIQDGKAAVDSALQNANE